MYEVVGPTSAWRVLVVGDSIPFGAPSFRGCAIVRNLAQETHHTPT